MEVNQKNILYFNFMNQYRYEATKLESGYVMVRDYNLNQCNNAKMDLVIVYKKKEMTIPHKDLKARAQKLSTRRFQSYFPGKPDYGVYHFKWIPDKVESKQVELPFTKIIS